MKISVIIPVYDNPEGLRRCLASVQQLRDVDFEVIVVDDGSGTSHEQVCAGFGARFIRLNDNVGAGVARNEGAKYAEGEILAFTDSDCVVASDWLARIRDALSAPDIVAVAGSFDASIGDNVIARQRLFEARYYHVKERCLVNSFTTSNFAIRTSVFKRVGGFPHLRTAEDLILGYRLMRLGYGVLWRYDLQVSQEFPVSAWKYFKQQANWMGSVLQLTLKYPELQRMTWSVKRGGLVWQLALQGVLVVLLPFGGLMSQWGPLSLLTLAALALLNLPFLAYCRREGSLLFASQVFALTVLVRNLAWLVGLAGAAWRNPVRTITRLCVLLMFQAWPLLGSKLMNRISLNARETGPDIESRFP